ncbi:MAG: tryptophan--tRNA ligase [Deltaproteobacteria bacterium]|nr:tryptophan--tRNA ligase [Deltaproteobacteria bacterium]
MNLPRTRVLSGIQSSGEKHLGNYFGAIQQHIELQHEFPGECFYFIADFHALTTVHDAAAMREGVVEVARSYLALGLNPDKALLFRQSDVPEVTELAWLLATVTGTGLLERGHSFKEKVAQGLKPSVGLFLYPVLMAADILVYGSTTVPVGKDQIQHVEMAQDMATHFNQTHCAGEPILRRPEWRLSQTPYVAGLDGRKMSSSYGNTLPLFASGKPLRKMIAAVATDSTPLGQPLDPDKCTVFRLLSLFLQPDELERVGGWYRAGKRDGQPFGYGHAKQLLAERYEAHFAAARARREELVANPQQVEDVLTRSAARARAVARDTLDRCRQACGLR